jgi:hypothetical protein
MERPKVGDMVRVTGLIIPVVSHQSPVVDWQIPESVLSSYVSGLTALVIDPEPTVNGELYGWSVIVLSSDGFSLVGINQIMREST